jgi:small-conductance mechanosensitive channel
MPAGRHVCLQSPEQEEERMDIPSTQGGILVAVLLISLFVGWAFAKRVRSARAFLADHLWAAAVVDFVLFPAAVLGTGRIVGSALGALGISGWHETIREITQLLVYLAIASGVARFAEVWILSQDDDGQETRLSQLARSVLYGFCLFVGLILFLTANGYTSNTLLYSTGVGAALVAFAMQQTLGDLFSGIALSIERPFRIGDWLRLSDGSEGEVTDINWRATRLRGWDNTTLVVPNGSLSRQSFTNLHGPRHLFAPWYFVRINGEADPRQVKALLEDAAGRCASVLREPAPVARLTDGTTIPYTYMVWVHFQNYPAMFAGREELYCEIQYALREAGLETAADIREVRYRPVDAAPVAMRATTGA